MRRLIGVNWLLKAFKFDLCQFNQHGGDVLLSSNN